MAKSASKNRSEVEFLKGELRRVKKQLSRIKKGDNVVIREEDLSDYQGGVEDDGDCPRCGKGTLTDIDLKYIIVTSCNLCEYTDRRKPTNAKKA